MMICYVTIQRPGFGNKKISAITGLDNLGKWIAFFQCATKTLLPKDISLSIYFHDPRIVPPLHITVHINAVLIRDAEKNVISISGRINILHYVISVSSHCFLPVYRKLLGETISTSRQTGNQ